MHLKEEFGRVGKSISCACALEAWIDTSVQYALYFQTEECFWRRCSLLRKASSV